MTIDPQISEWATRYVEDIPFRKEGKRRELKHLITCRRRKQNVIPPVAASERGTAQTLNVSAFEG